jgi:hypothetical protein
VADIVFDIAKGRVAELYNRVDQGDPAAARLYVIPVNVAAVTDATIRACDNFAAVITAGVSELTAGGWNRKTLTATDLGPLTVDHANSRMPLDLGDQTWTTVLAGNNSTDLVICAGFVASPTNATLVPLTMHDFAITTDGTSVVATIADFYRAA